MKISAIFATVVWISFCSQTHASLSFGTAFTYQGRLNTAGIPANGVYDLRFELYDALTDGNLSSISVTNAGTMVSNGLFTATLDFGLGAISGATLWLDIAVRTNGESEFAPLAPRQLLTPSPYAVYSASAGAVSPGSITSSSIPAGGIMASNIDLISLSNALGGMISGGGSPSLSIPLGLGVDVPERTLDIQDDSASVRVTSTNPASSSVIELGNSAGTAPLLGSINFTAGNTLMAQVAGVTNRCLVLKGGANCLERMRIATNGCIVVGNTYAADLGYCFYIWGDLWCNSLGSDVRWKKNILPLNNALDTVTNLQGVSFDWRSDEFPERHFASGRQLGFIAQEVEKVLPDIVHTASDGFKSLSYDKMTVVLVEAVKQQQEQISALKEENDSLKARIERIERQLAQ
jgi:hypothetical protein